MRSGADQISRRQISAAVFRCISDASITYRKFLKPWKNPQSESKRLLRGFFRYRNSQTLEESAK